MNLTARFPGQRPAQPTATRRLSRGVLLVTAYGLGGPAIGALVFILWGSVYLSSGVVNNEYPGQGVVALVFFSPLILVGALVSAMLPATLTGFMLGVELAVRGRVSWLAATIAPVAAMLINDQLFLKSPADLEHLLIAVFASLSLRFLLRAQMSGADTNAPADWSGLARSVAQDTTSVITSRRARIALAYLLAVPPVAALVFFIVGMPWWGPYSEVEYLPALMLTAVVGVFCAPLLGYSTRDGKPVSLLNAAWTPLPAWGLIMANSPEPIVLGLASAYLAATLVVTLAIGRRL
jgi:hypothetical protein